MNGSKFLKVTGILMIIFGAIGIVMSIFALIGVAALVALGASSILWLSAVIAVVGAVLELVAGIIGVSNAEKPEKAQTCLVWGCIVAGMSVLSNVITLCAYSESFSVFSLFTGLVIPVLYIIGALKNKQG